MANVKGEFKTSGAESIDLFTVIINTLNMFLNH